MYGIITLEGIDEALKDLGAERKAALKYRLLTVIRGYYDTENSVESLREIDTDGLVKILWETGNDPVAIKNRRKNLKSIKSAINTELTKLYRDGKNTEGIIIGPDNVFLMSDEARDNTLKSFKNRRGMEEASSLEQFRDVLNRINDFLTNPTESFYLEKNADSGTLHELKHLIRVLSEKVGLDEAQALHKSDSLPAEGTGFKPEYGEDGPNAGTRLYEGNLSVAAPDPNHAESTVEIGQHIDTAENRGIIAGEDIPIEVVEEPETITDEIDDAEIVDVVEEVEDTEQLETADLTEVEDVTEEIDAEEIDEAPEELLDEVDDGEDAEEFETADLTEVDDVTEEIDVEEIDEAPEEILDEVDDGDIEDIVEEIEAEEITDDIEEVEVGDIPVEVDDEPDMSGRMLEEEVPEEFETPDSENPGLLAEKFNHSLAAMDKYFNQYILIPGGDYTIGVNEPRWNETPVKSVHLPDFYCGKFPITNALFEIFVEKTGYTTTAEKLGHGTVYYGRRLHKIRNDSSGRLVFSGNSDLTIKEVKGACWYQPFGPGSTLHKKRNHPVVQISLEDAMAFAAWTGKRLPTEEEWEAAARTAHGYVFPWGNDWENDVCNTEESLVGDTTQVDQYLKSANEYGIMDLMGNVMEWTLTRSEYVSKEQNSSVLYITKGGSFISANGICLPRRSKLHPDSHSNILGFRCIAL